MKFGQGIRIGTCKMPKVYHGYLMKGLGHLWDFKIPPVTWKFWRFLKKKIFFFYHLRVCWIVHNGFLLQNHLQAMAAMDTESIDSQGSGAGPLASWTFTWSLGKEPVSWAWWEVEGMVCGLGGNFQKFSMQKLAWWEFACLLCNLIPLGNRNLTFTEFVSTRLL